MRFLQVQRRYVEDAAGRRVERLDVGDARYVPWDEACEQEIVLDLPLDRDLDTSIDVAGGTETEDLDGGRLVRVREPVTVGVTTHVEQPVSPYPVTLVTLRVENRTTAGEPGGHRPAWLRRALVACHVLLEVQHASFVSQLDPPQWASGFVAGCVNDGVFPVLAGPEGQAGVMLSSPIILYDHPQLAPAERVRVLRRPRDRRAAQPAHHDPHRRGEARDARHRPARRVAARRGGGDAGGAVGAPARHGVATWTR